MDISFEGYAAQAVTFYADEGVSAGDAVTLSDGMTVYKAEENSDIIGVALLVRDGYATVQTAGVVTLPASDFLSAGYTKLALDGEGKLASGETGPERLVICVDSSAGTATVLL